jgi:hypothetical protein
MALDIMEKDVQSTKQRNLEGLQDEKDKQLVLEGASRLQRDATVAHEMSRQGGVPRARIQEESW